MTLALEVSRLSSVLNADAAGQSHLLQLVDWIDGYLAQPHAELGRAGPVCPFARMMLDRDLLWVGTIAGATPTVSEVVETLRSCAATLRTSAPTEGPNALLRTLVVMFPDVVDVDLIETVQRTLKPDFVAEGLMAGQFYAGCTAAGLWNEEFRPLQSPVPLIAVRYMVSNDFPFLKSEPSWIEAYLRRFAPTVPPSVRTALSGGFVLDRT